MGKVATENTLQKGVDLLSIIARQNATFTDYKEVQEIVRKGLAQDVFGVGDQIVTTWNDGSHEYECPFDVVAFREVEKEDGSVVPGMIIQAHYGFAGIQFDGNEAFYHCDSALAAGSYYVTMGNNWGSNVVSGKSYTFTLTQTVPAGGQLLFGTATSTTGALPDTAPANWRVWSYESQTSTEPIEKVTLSEGTTGTSLGTLSSSTKYGNTGLNNMQRASYGYNRWSQSGIRQNMNSSDPAGEWWTPQNVFDRPPLELATKRGFMAGFPSDFLEVLSPVKVVTALNTVSDSDIGASEVTYDTFFLPSLEEEYCAPQVSGVEGAYWPYWKERLGISSPQASGTANALPTRIRYALENHTSAQYIRLRSANRYYASYAWIVSSTGSVTSHYATYSYRFAPACVIC